VPGETLALGIVNSIGLPLDRTPISLAHVSADAAANDATYDARNTPDASVNPTAYIIELAMAITAGVKPTATT